MQPQPQQYQIPHITTPPQHNPTLMSQYLRLEDQLFQPQPQPQPLPTLQSQPTVKKNEWGLSSETILKLAELRGLLYQHSGTFPDFDTILQGARHFAMQGDTTFLDEKLAFFRNFDAVNGGSVQYQHQLQSNQPNMVV
jgi:hypothetical protein